MEYDIHKAYTKYETSDIAVLKTLGKSGRFKDATLLESFKKTTKKDILDFIYYSSFYASSYYGINSLIVKYDDWVLLNCPVSYGEFFEAAKNATTNTELKEIAELYKAEILENDLFTYMGNDEESMVENGRVELAFAINEKHRQVAAYMDLPVQVGWSYFFKARMFDLLLPSRVSP